MTRTLLIPLGLLDPPEQPSRFDHDETDLAQLADSMRDVGLINAVLVEPHGERYRVIAGDRRARAARLLGWTEIRAEVRDGADLRATTQLRLAENLQRTDLSPIEEATELYRLYHDEQLNVERIATLVRRRPLWVEQRLELLNLPDDLGPLVHTRKLAIGAALALARCTDDDHRHYLTQYCLDAGASVHTVAMWIESWRLLKAANPNNQVPRPPLTEPGAAPIVLMPCAICRDAHDHRTMIILRLCAGCADTVNAPPPS